MKRIKAFDQLDNRCRQAVSDYWVTRKSQKERQSNGGKSDQGLRGAVTGGAQMDGFIELFADILADSGVGREFIFRKKAMELPGFFRPTKEWDLLVVKNETLIAAIEAKSQVGPSFGNNFNNRTEEAIGTALDLWTAFRDGAFRSSPQPFLGYFFMLEDCEASNRAVKVKEPHFKVFPEFIDASYARRYELFCRKLIFERQYTSVAFITSNGETGSSGEFQSPASDLSIVRFVSSLMGHVAGML
jgi:hypothetical protein